MHARTAASIAALALLAGAGCTDPGTSGNRGPQPGMLVVNATGQPVDIVVDGVAAVSAVPAGAVGSVPADPGLHLVVVRVTGTSLTTSLNVTATDTVLPAVLALRWGNALAASVLGDTNEIVPAGKTKVRVLHLAPNAGEIQVYRTQPDWATPISWQFPFLYDSLVNDLAAHPYLQSTVGTWDIRAWRTPADTALGWQGATARVNFALASGEKRTVLVLDKPGGGVTLTVVQ